MSAPLIRKTKFGNKRKKRTPITLTQKLKALQIYDNFLNTLEKIIENGIK
jgi:hypothetical protein